LVHCIAAFVSWPRRLLRQHAAMVLITQFTFGTGVRNKRARRKSCAARKDASRQQAPNLT
jgi:hypothetical protein